MEDDLTLWKKISTGDTTALKALHDKYYLVMYLYAKKYCNNRQVLDEAVSDCFIKLWTKRGHIVIEHSVKSYLFFILRNVLIDYQRKKERIILSEISSLSDIPDNEIPEDIDYLARLYNALEKLPEQRRRILELAVFESCSYAKIAEKLQISVNTVKTQIGRAYRFLREELGPKSIQLLFLLRGSTQK